MALKENLVSARDGVVALKKVMEGHFIKIGRRGVGGNVSADTRFAHVGSDDHGHGVPTDQAADATLEGLVARIGRLLRHGDCVDVRRFEGERDPRHQAYSAIHIPKRELVYPKRLQNHSFRINEFKRLPSFLLGTSGALSGLGE